MGKSNAVYLCVWSGDARLALDLAASHYPGLEIREFPQRRLRINGLAERIRLLRGFHGQAVIFFFESLADFKHRQVLVCFQLLHRCQATVLCDNRGHWESIRNIDILRSAPAIVRSLFLDAGSIVFWSCYLRLWLKRAKPAPGVAGGEMEIAYLIPSPANVGSGGGAISHIRGFLNGVKSAGIGCRVFTGVALAQDAFPNQIVPARKRPYFLWGAVMLAYNFVYVRGVQRFLGSRPPRFFYQRHFAFSIAGALLSRRWNVPLILEYNGSEVWMADHWDPNPLRAWIKLCEEVSLRSAARIVVVSEVLKESLLARGIEANRIRVNPNAVDPDYFYPGRGRESGRRELGIDPQDILIGFVGSFSFWHGIEILERAIASLLSNPQPCRLRFVLMGDGLLHGEMRSALAAYEQDGHVIFTGPLPRNKVAEYLDACDILVSPHVPMPDGSRFFGSPTKLFEYMAMGKGIVASRLDQLAEVLEHGRTAWLVTPGDPEELAAGILYLALNPAKREALGAAARQAAVERHSWSRNVACALGEMPANPSGHLETQSLMTLS
jgi:glycosyltransferase involved in cell wall biosynthesis